MLFNGLTSARAQDGILVPGDAVVTGFSGVMPTGVPAPGGSPLDTFFINPDGPSAQILSFGAFGGAPGGQLVTAAPKKVLKAKDIGQVFAVGLDDGLGSEVPNIYLGATAAFGLHIVRPDAADPSKFIRLKKGHGEAQWMAGMFGPDPAGGPGAIYKVDGKTGSVALFATLPGNSGAGVGDVVFDKTSKHIYASDLDSGLIHRIDSTGTVIDAFDHGVAGRPAKGLAALADDGRIADISNPAFDVENPDTWGFTQKERMVYGMAVHNGRLYYAVAGGHQVWSIGLNEDGSFAGDARWELDVKDLPGAGPITDMLFDKQGRMYLAQRGEQKASYSYTAFADDGKSAVVRYRLEEPDDAATESVWSPDREEYAIGKPVQHQRTNGGIALGYGHSDLGMPNVKACSNTLWSTGDRLRTSGPDAMLGEAGGAGPVMPADPAAEPDVHGLQGNDINLVRPENEPPNKAYFVDYDGNFGDPTAIGHIGDVEIWQPCQTDYAGYESFGGEGGTIPPGYLPPIDEPPGELPPEFPPPIDPYNTNLRLAKWAILANCVPAGAGHVCPFRVRVTNTGPDAYFGAIRVSDTLSAFPPGAITAFSPAGGWACWNIGPGNYHCWRPGVFLLPGASIELTMMTYIPNSSGMCHLTNRAEIVWAPGGTQWNTDPTDDIDDASANIPAPFCPTNRNLQLVKTFNQCWEQGGGTWHCQWDVTVNNTGPGVHVGPLQVADTMGAAPIGISFNPLWNCVQAGANANCVHPLTVIPPGGQRVLTLGAGFTEGTIQALGCQIPNTAQLTFPIGGTLFNTNPGDDTSNANAAVPPLGICVAAIMNKSQCPPGFVMQGGQCAKTGPQPILPQPPTEPEKIACPAGTDKVRRANVVDLRRKGWTLVRLRNGQWCGRPGRPPIVECPANMRKVATQRVARLRRQGWELLRLRGGQWCGRPGKPPIIDCPQGMQTVSARRVAALRQAGWTLVQLRDRRWCGKPGKPPIIECPRNMKPVSVHRLAKLRREGWTLTVLRNGKWCGRPGPIVTPCPKGMRKVAPSQLASLRKSGWILTRTRGGQWCGKPGPTPQPTCNKGERPVSSLRQATLLRRQGYTVRQAGRRLWCVSGRPIRPCKAGEVRRNGKCVPVICPRGFTGRPPNCKPPIICKKGQIRQGNRCITPTCPRGFTGRPPNCKRIIVCKNGQIRVGNRCITLKCPRGFTGRPPNCKRIIVCRKGQIRVGNRCITPQCPRGYSGRPPNCRKNHTPVRPQQTGPKSCPPNTYRASNGRCTVLR